MRIPRAELSKLMTAEAITAIEIQDRNSPMRKEKPYKETPLGTAGDVLFT